MPRSKPSREGGINVHRIELGGWERERIKKAELVAATAVILPAAGIAAVGIGGTLAAYALYQWLKDGPFTPITDAGEEIRQKVRDAEAEYRKQTPDVVESAVDTIIDNNPILRYNRWWYRLFF